MVKSKLSIFALIPLTFIVFGSCLSQETTLDAGKLRDRWVVAFAKSSSTSGDAGEYGLSMYFLPKAQLQSRENKYLVDTFDFNASPPSIVTVFYDQKAGIKYAIALVKWHISALGADTLADYYEINAYKLLLNPIPRLVKDEKMSRELGEGYDGQESGQAKHFYLKAAADIRKKFESLQ